MELLAANIKQEPREEELEPEHAAIKQELYQTEVFSVKKEVPELEEAAPESCPDASCVHIKEEVLDVEPTYIHRVFPDAELFCTTGRERTAADSAAAEGDADPETKTFCVPHSFFLPDRLPTDQLVCDRVTPRHFTIRADGFTPRMKFPCSRAADPDNKPYRCAACGKAFRRVDHLRRHQSMHTGDKPYCCGSCEKRFTLRRSLETHQRRCRGLQSCTCPVCGDVFQTFCNLQQHQRIHDGEKSYQCSRCGQNDKQSNYYREHQRVHCDDQPYLCLHCEKR